MQLKISNRENTMVPSGWTVLIEAVFIDSVWVALSWSDLLGLTLARKERREGDAVMRRAHAVRADFKATPDSLTSVNRVLGKEFLVKYLREKDIGKD